MKTLPLTLLLLLGSCAQPAPPTTTTTTPMASSSSSSSPTPTATATTTTTTTSSANPDPPKKEQPVDPPVVVGQVLGSPLTNAVTTSSDRVADADSVILGVRPKLKACYETVRGTGPAIAGMVSCSVRITKDGKVAAISVVRRDRLPNPLVDCIVKELKTAQFAARADEQLIQVPVRFAVPGED